MVKILPRCGTSSRFVKVFHSMESEGELNPGKNLVSKIPSTHRNSGSTVNLACVLEFISQSCSKLLAIDWIVHDQSSTANLQN